jgi:hypothetical protein
MSSVRLITYWVLISLFWIALIVSAVLGAISTVTATPHTLFGSIVKAIQGYKPLIAVFTLTGLLSRGAINLIGPSPAQREALHRTLNHLQQFLFKGADGHQHDFRLTIFRYSKWNWRILTWRQIWKRKRSVRNGWLMPYMRTGYLTLNCHSCWNVPADGNNIEGIAGRAYSMNKVITIESLPLLRPNSKAHHIAKYADKVWITPDVVNERLAKGSSLARSYCGFPIEVKGKPWGVIVIDSKDPKLPDDDPVRFQKMMGLMGQIIGNIAKGS